MTKSTLIEFPCHFPVKIIGTNSDAFLSEIKQITLRHFPAFVEEQLSCALSQKNNFLSITVTVFVHTQEGLDAYYQEVTKHPDVKMVL